MLWNGSAWVPVSVLQLTGGTMSGAIAMGANKITGLANGTAPTDAAAFGQIPASTPALTITADKTANYTANANEFVPCNTGTIGAFTLTFPTAPANGTLCGFVFKIGGLPHNLTIAPGGSDVFATNVPLTYYNVGQLGLFQYESGTWTPIATGMPELVGSDGSVVVVPGAYAYSFQTGTLDVIANTEGVSANWSNNSHKITSLANGSASDDAAAFGQVPLAATTVTGPDAFGASPAVGTGVR